MFFYTGINNFVPDFNKNHYFVLLHNLFASFNQICRSPASELGTTAIKMGSDSPELPVSPQFSFAPPPKNAVAR